MRTRDALQRLAAAAPAVELPVDTDEDRILARILASRRRPAPAARPRRVTIALVGVVLLGAAGAVASIELAQRGGATAPGGHGLTGAKLSLAGYAFSTPAGFQRSSTSCGPSATDRFAAAASADGGCVEAFFMLSFKSPLVPAGSEPVEVGAYQGHLVSQGDPQRLTLYVDLPAMGAVLYQDVVLFAQGLTADELVAVAASGLPATPVATVS